jgi:alkylated DNA repair dioxygenase AlkB
MRKTTSESRQAGLFGPDTPLLPGLRYQAALISPDEESRLLRHIRKLPFQAFEFHGFLGKRRTVSFGWKYDFGQEGLHEAEDLPAFLLPLRARAARFAGLAPDDLRHALVTEYDVGAGIGWHRDKNVFGDVIGLSLLSPCKIRFRRKTGATWERRTILAEPGSAYLLQGPSRTEWEHSIAPVDQPRYSVTFRTLRRR